MGQRRVRFELRLPLSWIAGIMERVLHPVRLIFPAGFVPPMERILAQTSREG